GGVINLPAFLIVFVLMILLCIGVRHSARFNAVMVFVKLGTIAIFIGVAAFNVNPDNWTPFLPFGWFGEDADGRPVGVLAVAAIIVSPRNWTRILPFGWLGEAGDGRPGGVLAGAAIVFFAYIGFDAVSTAAEECDCPERNLPIGIISSLVVCTVV